MEHGMVDTHVGTCERSIHRVHDGAFVAVSSTGVRLVEETKEGLHALPRETDSLLPRDPPSFGFVSGIHARSFAVVVERTTLRKTAPSKPPPTTTLDEPSQRVHNPCGDRVVLLQGR